MNSGDIQSVQTPCLADLVTTSAQVLTPTTIKYRTSVNHQRLTSFNHHSVDASPTDPGGGYVTKSTANGSPTGTEMTSSTVNNADFSSMLLLMNSTSGQFNGNGTGSSNIPSLRPARTKDEGSAIGYNGDDDNAGSSTTYRCNDASPQPLIFGAMLPMTSSSISY